MTKPELIQDLDQRAKAIAKDFLKLESELIDILQKLDEHKAFVHLGYASLFQYAITELKLSESAAYNYITIARKSLEVPALKEEIKLGTLSVSKARRIVPVLNQDNANLWIKRAKEMPKWELERHLAQTCPKAATRERYDFVRSDRLQLQVGVSEDLMKKLIQVQELLSQRRQKAASLEDALEVMTTEYLTRHDPIEKCKRREAREEKKVDQALVKSAEKTTPEKPPKSPFIAAIFAEPLGPERVDEFSPWIREQALARDGWQCRYMHANGKRCAQRRWLQVHHVIARSKGGSDDLDNLVTLCVNHHRWIHLQGERRVAPKTTQPLALPFG